MTLGELIHLVGDKVNMTDTKTLALMRRFASRRHDMIARMGLWRELLGMWPLGMDKGRPEVFLPDDLDTVVALRVNAVGDNFEVGADFNIGPLDGVRMFMTDPGAWERAGTPAGFVAMPSLAMRRLIGGDSDSLKAGMGYAQIHIYSDSPQDVGIEVTVDGGPRMREKLMLTGTTPVVTAQMFHLLHAVTKSKRSVGRIHVAADMGWGGMLHLNEIAPEELCAPVYRRIRLLEVPAQRCRAVVLGKRRVGPLREDGDSTAFAGMDLALEAFVLADTYEWLRQMQDAQEKRQEAMAMLDVLKREEFYQEAGQQQLVPHVWGGEVGDYHNLHGGI